MNTVNFVAGWFGGTRGVFASPVSYIIGQSDPIEVQIDLTGNKEHEDFVSYSKIAAAVVDKRPDARMLLVTEDSKPMKAIVRQVIQDNPVRIVLQPEEDNLLWLQQS